jgi:hypothetical protein
MARYTPEDKKRLTPEIIAAYHEAGQKGDVEAFRRLLGQYGSHLSRQEKDKLIEEFSQHAAVLREALRKRRS